MNNYQLSFRIHKGPINDENNCTKVIQKDEKDFIKSENLENTDTSQIKEDKPKLDIVWFNVYGFIVLHSFGFYGLYRCFTGTWAIANFVFVYWSAMIGGLGITAGPHRLWTHRSYKARLPMRILLAIMNATAAQNSIYTWVRDHRAHHKFVETNADPHNSNRGFFFAHMGWLMCKKHPDVINKGKTIDMSDVWNDPVVRLQYKYFVPMIAIFCFTLPTLFHYYILGQDFAYSFCFGTIWRYLLILHITWLVNSAAHLFGNHPYDESLVPAENFFVSFIGAGEGWHNYHHVFPWDYKTSELGFYKYNLTTAFIDFFYWIGWAYDLKIVSKEMVKQRVSRTGDGTHAVWGWGDRDISEQHTGVTEIINPYEKPLPFM